MRWAKLERRSDRFMRGQPCSQGGARGNPARLVAGPGFDELLGYAASLQAHPRPGIGVSGDHALGNIQHVDLQPAPALFLEPGGGF